MPSPSLKTLATIATILGVPIGIWGLLPHPKDIPPTEQQAAKQPPPVTITIDAKQTNTQTVAQPSAIASAAVEKPVLAAHQEKLPVHRQVTLAPNTPVQPVTGFWLTFGLAKFDNVPKLTLSSPIWGNQEKDVSVNDLPFHFTVDDKTYLLHIDAFENDRLTITVSQ